MPADNFDDWSGVIDPAVRRRVQNRLNQRRYRLRRKSRPSEAASHGIASPDPWFASQGGLQGRMQQLRLTRYMSRSPSDDHLSCVVQFNVMQGFDCIMGKLGLLPSQMLDESSASPFVAGRTGDATSWTACVAKGQGLGPLSPTLLQRTTAHHPWVDVIPFPQMRDNIIETLYSQNPGDEHAFDPDELCYWMLGFETSQNQRGLVLWGDPCAIDSWEVSAEFAQQWAWLLRGCADLFTSTDAWRERRGEMPLQITRRFSSLQHEAKRLGSGLDGSIQAQQASPSGS